MLTPYFDLISNLIAKGRQVSRGLLGRDPYFICLPFIKEQQSWLFQFSDSWNAALAHFADRLENHFPANKLLHFSSQHDFVFPSAIVSQPIPNAVTVFTDGLSNGKAAYVINDSVTSWFTGCSSTQEVELCAVFAVLQHFTSEPLNVLSDSHYVVTALNQLEMVPFIHTVNSVIQQLFCDIQALLHHRINICFFGHIHAHSGLPGALASGNALADSASHIFLSQTQLAERSHQLHHQNSNTLRLQFKIPCETARQIVNHCPVCPQLLPVPHYGVNPHGLLPNHLWQMDVTHILSFGKLKYVHINIDTFSGYIFASLQTEEAAQHCVAHCLAAFSIMGTPKTIKTDNGPGYTSVAFLKFCSRLSISFKTGIPYNPQGQGIIERAHQTLKHQLLKLKKGELYPLTPYNYIHHALFILNF